ncbi:MAG: VOC family protein [Acidimicrobiales bacterium]
MGIQARNPHEEDELREDDDAGEPIDEAYDGGVEPAVLTAVDHVALVVDDLDEAVADHRDLFGVLVEHRDVWHEDDAEVAVLGVGPSSIWLIAPTSDDSEYAEFLAEGGPGLHHVGYRVADVDEALEALRAAGREVIDESGRPGPGDTRVALVHPDGTYGALVMLVER